MKYPKRIKYRGRVLATIYGKCKGRDSYRVAWQVAGKRHMASFPSYSLAKSHADGLVRDLAKGSQVTALNPSQARDALAALERLQAHYQSTGRRVSLLACASEFAEAAAKLNGRTLNEAVEGYLRTAATLKPKPLSEAIEEFIASNKPRTVSQNGQRPDVDPVYAGQRAKKLRKFAATFPNYAACDLSKMLLDTFIAALPKMKYRPATSPKTRNHYRGAIGQFLRWAVRNDYLPTNHRLFEADSMRPEKTNGGDTDFYTPKELRALLEAADGPLRAIVAIGGLAGLRTQEILRLDWGDVWRIPGHIEVTSAKAKTRQRRLVEICPALQAWLEPFRRFKTGKLWQENDNIFQKSFLIFCQDNGVERKANGLRHAFCTYHYSLHGNENLTAQQAGNSPAMVHSHYKGLATKKEAERWFAVKPAKAAQNIVTLPQRRTGQ